MSVIEFALRATRAGDERLPLLRWLGVHLELWLACCAEREGTSGANDTALAAWRATQLVLPRRGVHTLAVLVAWRGCGV